MCSDLVTAVIVDQPLAFPGFTKKGTHPDTAIMQGYLGKLLKPMSSDYIGHCKATFRDNL